MPTPTFTSPPAVPVRNDATTFSARFAAFLTWMATFVTEEETAVAWLEALAADVAAAQEAVAADAESIAAAAALAADAAGLLGRMTGSLALGTGTKAITLEAARPALATANRQVALVLESDASIKMFGQIAASPTPTSTAFSVTVTSGGVFPSGGVGTFSGWKVMDAAFFPPAATKAEVLAALIDFAPIAPNALREALEPFALTDAATVTPSGLDGRDYTWTIGGNRTLGAITNTYPGATGEIEITQDGTGSRVLAWASGVYFRKGGLPVLSTPAGSKDYLRYRVKAVDGGGVATRVVVTFIKAPTN